MPLPFSQEISQPVDLKFLTCERLLSTTILHLTGSFPKNEKVSDFSGDISIPKFFATFLM
jgi:hypothetical protein